jgi:hypothetical protein
LGGYLFWGRWYHVPNNSVIISGEKELMNRLQTIEKGLQDKIIHDALHAGAEIVKREAEANSVFEILIDVERFQAKIGPDKEHWYANIIEHGAKKHIIKIVRKKALSNSKEILGSEIRHPGIKKKPFLRPALDNNLARIEQEMGKVIAKALGVE